MGWPEQAPFDRIIITAAAAGKSASLINQLAPDGIMIAPMGDTARDQHLYKFTFDEAREIQTEKMCPVRFVPLIGDDASDLPVEVPVCRSSLTAMENPMTGKAKFALWLLMGLVLSACGQRVGLAPVVHGGNGDTVPGSTISAVAGRP